MHVTVQLLSGALVLEDCDADPSSSILDLKGRIQDLDGTPARKQQLLTGPGSADDSATLSSLDADGGKLVLTLLRKEGVSFSWQVSGDELSALVFEGAFPMDFVTSPCFGLESAEMVEGTGCKLQAFYYPRGLRSPMHRPGFSSLLFGLKPHAELLQVRATLAGREPKQQLFSSANSGTTPGWVNFLEGPAEECGDLQLDLEVLYCGRLPDPVEAPPPEQPGALALAWDLRRVLGGLAFPAGKNYSRLASAQGVQLRLTFFPGGQQAADVGCCSLRVLPIEGLGDRRYECSLDGGRPQRGGGEGLFHFERAGGEAYGLLRVAVLPSRDAAAAAAAGCAAGVEPVEEVADAEEEDGAPPPRRRTLAREGLLSALRAVRRD